MGLKSNMLVMVMVIGALGSAPLMAEAQLGIGPIVGSLLRMIIQGTVFCTADGNVGTNATSTPVFPNARVQLQCGNGNIVSTATTNNNGIFMISLDPISMLSSFLNGCNLVVQTPLSNCNVTLPSTGFLTSTMQFLGNFVQDGIQTMKIAPMPFTFINRPST